MNNMLSMLYLCLLCDMHLKKDERLSDSKQL